MSKTRKKEAVCPFCESPKPTHKLGKIILCGDEDCIRRALREGSRPVKGLKAPYLHR